MEIDQLSEKVHHIATDLEKTHKSAQGIEFSFLKIVSAVGAADLIKDHIKEAFAKSELRLKVEKALTEENIAQVGYTRKRLAFEAGGLAVMLAASRELFLKMRSFNQNLIEANSHWQHRHSLMVDSLMAQTQLGIGFEEITKSAAALVHYGMDTEASFEANLHLVAQMEQGLGVAVGESAKLASIVERQLKGSFEGVAHTIAQIVDDTALAGDEAARLATNIATALGRLRPGISAATLPEVVRLVGRYESALKEVGGQSGAFTQLLQQLTTPEGLVGAGALGVSPEFLATSQGVQQVMERFAKYGEMLVGQSEGWERQMRLQALAQIFNVSADQANQMLIAIKRANETQMGQISLQDRWRNQLSATNSGIQRLGNSLMGLLQGAMYPVVFAVGALANRLADAVEWILKAKEVVYVIGGALFVGTIILTARMWGLVRALTAVALSSSVAQAALNRQAGATTLNTAAQHFGRFTPMSIGEVFRQNLTTFRTMPAATTFGTRMAGWFPTFTSGFAALVTGIKSIGVYLLAAVKGITLASALTVGAIAAFAAVAAVLWYKAVKAMLEIKRLNEENAAAQKIIISKEEALAAQRRAQVYKVARYSEDPSSELMKALEMRLQDITARQDISWGEKRRQMDKAQREFEEDTLKARFSRLMFTPIVERTPQEQKIDKDLQETSGKGLEVQKKMEGHMIRRMEQERERLEEEKLEKAKDRVYNPMRLFVPGSY